MVDPDLLDLAVRMCASVHGTVALARPAHITAKWAKKAGVAYVSPFWAGQFFSYLDWTPALDAASFPILTRTSNQAVSRAFLAGDLSTYGGRWARAL